MTMAPSCRAPDVMPVRTRTTTLSGLPTRRQARAPFTHNKPINAVNAISMDVKFPVKNIGTPATCSQISVISSNQGG